MDFLIPLILIVVVVAFFVRAIRIIPQANAGVVERLGRYDRTLEAGLNLIIPFIDRLRPLVDLREQVVSLSASAGNHLRQPRGGDRHRRLLPSDQSKVRTL